MHSTTPEHGFTPPKNLICYTAQLPIPPTELVQAFGDNHFCEMIEFLTVIYAHGTLITTGEMFEDIRHQSPDDILYDACLNQTDQQMQQFRSEAGYITTYETYERSERAHYLFQLLANYSQHFVNFIDQWLGHLKNQEVYAIRSVDVAQHYEDTINIMLTYQNLYAPSQPVPSFSIQSDPGWSVCVDMATGQSYSRRWRARP